MTPLPFILRSLGWLSLAWLLAGCGGVVVTPTPGCGEALVKAGQASAQAALAMQAAAGECTGPEAGQPDAANTGHPPASTGAEAGQDNGGQNMSACPVCHVSVMTGASPDPVQRPCQGTVTDCVCHEGEGPGLPCESP